MSAVDRAAEIVGEMLGNGRPGATYLAFAEALAAADPPLLVTDEIHAVLDAVGAGYEGHEFAARSLDEAWVAYLASRPS